MLSLSSVTRFAQPDIVAVLRVIWEPSQQHKEVRAFVLRLIWLGSVKDCADLTADAALQPIQGNRTSLVAGRALLAAGDDVLWQTYATHIKRDCASLPSSVVREGIEGLFPQYTGVDDLVETFAVAHQRGEMSYGLSSWAIEKPVENLSSPDDLTRLTGLLLQQLRMGSEDAGGEEIEKKVAVAELLAPAAERILELLPPDNAPAAAIDAILYLGDRCNHLGLRGIGEIKGAVEGLH